jgi:drug/metabolite transporter (DMT)-like permease
MTDVVLALVASTGWGVSDFLGGVATCRSRLLLVLAGSQVAGLLAFAPVLLVHGTAMPADARLLYAVAAGFVGVIELALIYVALEHGRALVMAPIAALSAVVPVVVGIATGDRIDLLIASGIACALAGAAAAAFVPAGERRPARDALLAAAIAVGAALCTGAGFVLVNAASQADPWWAIGGVHASGTVAALTVLAVTARAGHPRAPSRVPWRVALAICAVGLSDVGAGVAYANATRGGSLSVVAVLSSLYPVVTIALGVAALGERPARVQLAGAALSLVGVAILAASTG